MLIRTLSYFVLFLYLFSTFFFNSSLTQATNYDVVVSVEINQSTYTVLEIEHLTNTINLYEFDENALPVLINQQQVVFDPSDLLFNEKIFFLANAMTQHELDIASSSGSFSFQMYCVDEFNMPLVIQNAFDGPTGKDYRGYIHHGLNQPFSINDQIGTLSTFNVVESNYNGFKYTPSQQNQNFTQTSIYGPVSNSPHAGLMSVPVPNNTVKGRISFKIEGTTSNGRKVKIEDKGDGKGPKVYE